jgi:selenocysteine lyase/cysteine desulfurase
MLQRLPAGWEAASPLDAEARSHILCLRGPSPARTEMGFEALRAAKVVTSLRGGRIRVAPHLYNQADDVDRLVSVLADATKG